MEPIIAPVSKELIKSELTPAKKLRDTNKGHNEIFTQSYGTKVPQLKRLSKFFYRKLWEEEKMWGRFALTPPPKARLCPAHSTSCERCFKCSRENSDKHGQQTTGPPRICALTKAGNTPGL